MSNKIRIRKRGSSYSYSFDIAKSPRRMKEKGGFATEKEAFDAGIKAYTDWKIGNIGITSERVRLRDYLTAWLQNVVRSNVKRTTFKNYHNAVHSRIVPYLGNTYLQELRPRDIDRWVKELARAGLSQGTIRQTKTVLSTALKYAIYPAELIATNPTMGINIPRSAPRKIIERTVITPAQFAAIPVSNKYYPLLKILYHTGLRISEALGLTWDDIDLETGAFSISRQRIQAGYFDTPKTATSTRIACSGNTDKFSRIILAHLYSPCHRQQILHIALASVGFVALTGQKICTNRMDVILSEIPMHSCVRRGRIFLKRNE